jgi:hypothetical protein
VRHAGRRTRNDQHSPDTLITVTTRSNRSKADQDPATWLPPVAGVQCRYVGERVGTELRWGLAVDAEELETLTVFGEACEATVVTYTAAP